MKKICFRITLTLTVLTMTEHVAARPHAAQGTLLWQPTVTASGAGFTNSVAVDNQGNVVAAGYTGNTGGVLDFTVAKFDRDGTLL